MSMATTSINKDAVLNWAVAQISSMAAGICENCYQRPKSGTHRYCGKTCAAEAATAQRAHPAKSRPRTQMRVPPVAPKLVQPCDYCGQKPKFGNFDHCGKSCASKAVTTPPVQPPVQGRPAPKQNVRPPATAQIQHVKGSKPARSHVISHLAKDESSEDDDDDDYPDADEEDEDETDPHTDIDAYLSDDDELVPAPPTRSAKAKHASPKPSTPARRVTGICVVPNCGKPSFVDKGRVKADYCSTRHREEAVTLGLVPGCIMCHRYPQSGTDYFCSAVCRHQSMTKT